MGKDVAAAWPEAKSAFDRADAALGEPLSTLCFEGPEDRLVLTANTQPALVATSAALLAAFRAEAGEAVLSTVVAAAGHSLGEYSALVAASALTLEQAITLVRTRGRAMQEAVAPGVGAMAAVMGLSPDDVTRLCAEAASETGEVVSPANFNGTQIVIAGHAGAVLRASAMVEAQKGKVIPLRVSAPFHSALMEPAAQVMAAALETTIVQPLAFPVYANVDGAPNRDESRVKGLLVQQIAGVVRWEETVRALVRDGVTHAVEVGPGKVLAGLAKRIDKSLVVLPCADAATLTASVGTLRAAVSAPA
jgi:[acyl-carrier-protein] S-malonyltransferase